MNQHGHFFSGKKEANMRKESLILASLKKVWTAIHHTAVFLNLRWQSLLKVRLRFHQMLAAHVSARCHRRTISVGLNLNRGFPGGCHNQHREGWITLRDKSVQDIILVQAISHFLSSSCPTLLSHCGQRGNTDLPEWVQSCKGAAPPWAKPPPGRQRHQGLTHSGRKLPLTRER